MSNSKMPQRKQRAMGDVNTGKASAPGVKKFAKGGAACGVHGDTGFSHDKGHGKSGTPSKRASAW